MKPTKKNWCLLGRKRKFEFDNIKFKFNFPAKETKYFFRWVHKKSAFNKKYQKPKGNVIDLSKCILQGQKTMGVIFYFLT